MTTIPTNNPIILKPAIRRDVSDVDRLRVVERDRDIRDSQNLCSSLLDGVLCSSLLASSELGDRHWRDQQKKRWLAWWVLKHQKLVDVAVCLRTLKRSLWEMTDICNFWLRIYVDESIHYWCAASILFWIFLLLAEIISFWCMRKTYADLSRGRLKSILTTYLSDSREFWVNSGNALMGVNRWFQTGLVISKPLEHRVYWDNDSHAERY